MRVQRQTLVNGVLALWLLADLVRVVAAFPGAVWAPLDWMAEAVYVVVLVILLANVLRRSGLETSNDPLDYVAPAAAVAMPLVLVPLIETGAVSTWAGALRLAGTLGLLWSSVYLGRSFSVFVRYLRTVSDGPYAIVRHPMYLSFLVFDLGFVVEASDRTLAILLWLLEAGVFAWRALREERFLLARDAGYRRYRERVGFFLPRVKRPRDAR